MLRSMKEACKQGNRDTWPLQLDCLQSLCDLLLTLMLTWSVARRRTFTHQCRPVAFQALQEAWRIEASNDGLGNPIRISSDALLRDLDCCFDFTHEV